MFVSYLQYRDEFYAVSLDVFCTFLFPDIHQFESMFPGEIYWVGPVAQDKRQQVREMLLEEIEDEIDGERYELAESEYIGIRRPDAG